MATSSRSASWVAKELVECLTDRGASAGADKFGEQLLKLSPYSDAGVPSETQLD